MNAPGTRWWWHGDHRDSQGCTATPPLCPWLTHPVRSESSKCVLSRHKYYFIIVPWPAPTVPTWEELSACLKSRGLRMIKGRCLYRMSLMFFWQEPSIVTVYGLLSVRSAVAARWTAVGPAAPERHMYGGPERNPSTTGCSVCGKQQEDCETTHSASSGHDSRQAFFLFSSIAQISAYTCSSPCSAPTITELLALFGAAPAEHAMQNVLSCDHRMFYFHCRQRERERREPANAASRAQTNLCRRWTHRERG